MVRVRLSWLAVALGALVVSISHAEAAVTASITTNQLVVTGDALNNAITLRVLAGDSTRIEVLDGAAVVGAFSRGLFATILVQGNGGDDTIVLSRANGEITENATLNGGIGNNTITGGAGSDHFIGGDNDRFIWNPGDGSDVFDGGPGTDVVEINGSDAAEVVGVAPNGTRVLVTRDVSNVTFDIGTTESLVVNMQGGNDTLNCTGNLAALIKVVVNAGAGDDIINGSNGIDVVIADDGNDTVDANQGNDTIFAGAGNDRLIWNPGDGNDVFEGQSGIDKLEFNGANLNEIFSIDPNGGRVRLTRNVANVVMDLDDVEVIEIKALAGIDVFSTATSLAGTDVTSLILDGGLDNDTISGSDTDDELRGGAGVDIIDGRKGNDLIVPGPGDEGSIQGGDDNDSLVWNDGDGTDSLEGGDGNDVLFVNGTNAGDVLSITRNGARVRLERITPTAMSLDLGTTENIQVGTLSGDDALTIGPNLTGLVGIGIDLGPGADTLNTMASSVVNANGNTEIDTLNFDSQGQLISTTPTSISVAGVVRVTHVNFEAFNFPNALNPPPTMTITSPTTSPTTTSTTPFVTLAGTAADTTGLASITWVSDRGGSGVADGTTSWTVLNVTLFAGVNLLTVTATDTSGNQAIDTLQIVVNTLSYTMAEGATGGFFDTDILIANPHATTAPVTITYLNGDGSTVTQNLDLPATSRTTIAVDSIAGLENAEVSSTVRSNAALPLVVERTMRWDSTGYGAHTERATDAPANTWFFAEGSQGFFQTFVLLANPGQVSNDATITFLLESGAPVVKHVTLTPTSRQTVDTSVMPELANQSFGIIVSFTQPGVAERAMYFSTPGSPIFNAGHESAGVNAPSTSWFLAEGATGSFFTTFVLLANPGTSDATATVTFLPATGLPVTKTHVVPAGRRLTLNIAAEDASLADNAVATQVIATQPILVERAQYWPFTPDKWYEAHNSFGGTALGTKWGLAEGRVGGPESYQTYILLANANATQSAQVTITFLRTSGTILTKNFTVSPSSRFNVHVNGMVPELANESFGAVVQVTSGPGIFVERALYSDSKGVVFAAGTNALATRLP